MVAIIANDHNVSYSHRKPVLLHWHRIPVDAIDGVEPANNLQLVTLNIITTSYTDKYF